MTSKRGCCKASRFKWLNTGNADPTTLNLKWRAVGHTPASLETKHPRCGIHTDCGNPSSDLQLDSARSPDAPLPLPTRLLPRTCTSTALEHSRSLPREVHVQLPITCREEEACTSVVSSLHWT